MKRFLIAVAALACSATAAWAAPSANLVTVVTSQNAQTQLMSMVLTMQSIQQGAAAHVLLCGPAGDLALKEPPASATAPQKPKGMSPQGLMKKIIGAGGVVEVCAIYLPSKGVDADALIEGVGLAMPPAMAARLIADDTTVLSF
ncbi:MAG: hypothetical protein AAFV62_00970 [Pseudomonadota bacterium]